MSKGHAAELRRATAPASDSGSFWTGRRLGQVRARLEERRRALEGALRDDRAHDIEDRDGPSPGHLADPAESADWLIAVDSATTARAARELAEVDAALERLDAGSYGACVDCETPISPVRLIYAPQASRCLGCQERIELRGPGARAP